MKKMKMTMMMTMMMTMTYHHQKEEKVVKVEINQQVVKPAVKDQ
jgi:hypothetical protein